ncbi:MAG: tyrosine-type recombinase/integrase [bacterium]|nr:tyrosine-type recombinase/integrase [bacterium]
MGKRRTIPLSAFQQEVLVKWLGKHHGLLFPQFSLDVISRKFRRWVTKIGLPKGIRLHSLRATFACELIDRGCDVYSVVVAWPQQRQGNREALLGALPSAHAGCCGHAGFQAQWKGTAI